MFKSGNSGQNEQNIGIEILNERHVASVDGEDFDFFHSRMRLIYCIDYDDDEWNCTCPCFFKSLAAKK